MDKYIKRLQTRASRKGISVTKQQVREVYTEIVGSPESPSEEEMSAVIQQLETQFQAPSYEVDSTDLEIAKPQITEITPESNPDILETLQPPTEQPTPQQEPQQMTPTMTPAQPAQPPSSSTLATSNGSGISRQFSSDLELSEQQVEAVVQQEFGVESQRTKEALINYGLQRTFKNIDDLRYALRKIAQTERETFLKIISDYNDESASNKLLYQSALQQAQARISQEDDDFFALFEQQINQMKAV